MIPDNDPNVRTSERQNVRTSERQNLRTSEPQNLTSPNRRRLRQASLYLATIAGFVLFVLLSVKLAPPVRANADDEQMPLPQLERLRCALETRGVSSSLYETLIIPDNSDHAFGYWYDWDGVSSIGGGSRVYLVGERVEAFFAAHQ